MRKGKGLLCAVLCFALCFAAGCAKEDTVVDVYRFGYSTGINADGKYDSSLFYRNDLDFSDAADPGAYYEDGWFYAFPTGAPLRVFRTKNFANWELCGAVQGYAFVPAEDSWAYGNYWAPEVIKSKTDGKYYLYYSASIKDGIDANIDALGLTGVTGAYTDRLQMGVAVSDSVTGPYTECRDGEGKVIRFDIASSEKGVQLLAGKSKKVWAALDPSPFYDGEKLYLYFAKSQDSNSGVNELWGMEMTDMAQPDYGTLKRLTRAGYKSVTDDTRMETEQSGSGYTNINEAPNMLKHTTAKADGTQITKYYLSMSVFGYTDRKYAVTLAMADSPLGDFVKLDVADGQPLLGIDLNWDFLSGTGHHMFVQAEDELYMIYHAQKDRLNGGSRRGLAADKVIWYYDEALGYDMLHANGPTYSLQPVPGGASGYTDIAADAVVAATNVQSGYDAKLLTDDFVTVHYKDRAREFRTGDTGTTVTLEYAQSREVAAVMVYNSYEAWLAFAKLDKITFTAEDGKQYSIDNLAFPAEYYKESFSDIRPASAAIAVIKPLKVKKITITITEKLNRNQTEGEYKGMAISEIRVLGK